MNVQTIGDVLENIDRLALSHRERDIAETLVIQKEALKDQCSLGANPHYDKLPTQLIDIYLDNYRSRALGIISRRCLD